MSDNQKIPKKRGRKSKKELELIKNNILNNNDISSTPEKIYKKRGRKPKGGKIISNNKIFTSLENDTSVILHLKCSLKDIDNNNSLSYNPDLIDVIAHNQQDLNSNNLVFNDYNNNNDNYTSFDNFQNIENNNENEIENNDISNNKIQFEIIDNTNNDTSNNNVVVNDNYDIIYQKLIDLDKQLKTNCLYNRKPDCFWCHHSYDNPTIYIPSYE